MPSCSSRAIRSRSSTTARSRRRASRRACSSAMVAWLASDESVSTSSASNPRGSAVPTASRPIVLPPRWSGAASRTTALAGSTNASMAAAGSSAGSGPARRGRAAVTGDTARGSSSPSGPVRSRTATSLSSSSRAFATTASSTRSTSDSEVIASETRCRARADAPRASSSWLRARSAPVRASIRANAIAPNTRPKTAVVATIITVSRGKGSASSRTVSERISSAATTEIGTRTSSHRAPGGRIPRATLAAPFASGPARTTRA